MHLSTLLAGPFLCAILLSSTALAEDSMSQVLERMKSSSAVRIGYRETRYLELFEAPVESTGSLYSSPPDGLIKEQKTPARELLGLLDDHFYYYNPQSGIHHARAQEKNDPMTLRITAFQALANGSQTQLQELYAVSFYTEPGYWYLILSEKNTDESRIRITISGTSGQPAERFEIHESDGDRSVYQLSKQAEGEKVRIAFSRLQTELTGE